MKVFEYADYREFLVQTLQRMPRKGYGQLAKIAQALDINPSVVTLVMKGEKHFTLEQAADLAAFLELSELETEFLLALVGHARAGKKNLKAALERKMEKLKAQAESLKDRLPPKAELTEEAKAVFYSHWYYSALRMLSAIDGKQTPEEMARHLGLPKQKARAALDFLLRHGLCVEEGGKIRVGAQSTHLGEKHPLVSRHHANWRERAITSLDRQGEHELFFTSPATIGKSDIPKVRKILMDAIEEAFKVIDPSPCEEALCLNIDWFRF